LKIARLPAYKHLLELHKAQPGAVLLDIGCCCASFFFFFVQTPQTSAYFSITVGNDIRKAVADGWPVENAIAADINGGESDQVISYPHF
jgi:hypothetical protein